MMFSSCTLFALLFLAQQAAALPTGFIAEVVSQVKATTGRFVPNPSNDDQPMLVVINKNGEVHAVQDLDSGNDNGRKILDLRGRNMMCTNGERGLQAIEAHPQFYENRWIYLYYNQFKDDCLEDADEGPSNVLARYTMNAETLELQDEEILLVGAPMEERVHNGGAMAFGKDGKLYLTTGDAGVRENAQNNRNLHGSLLRLNDDGTVPSDNPFAADGTGVPCGQSRGRVPGDAPVGAVCAEIWSYGFRNPFRMALDPTSPETRFAISDVGAQHWEEISWGGTSSRGKSFGWPQYEGPCKPGTVDSCEVPPEDSNVVQPFHFYEHMSFENGGCISGSTFVPEFTWPEQYKYLFIDFIFLKIYSLVEDPSLECLSCSPPISGYRNETFYESIQDDDENVNEARMVDLNFGPDGALYVNKFGNRDSVIRIRYTGSVNAPPLPVIEIKNPLGGSAQQEDEVAVGNVVQFDGSKSSDPEEQALTYLWDFGDGDTSAAQSPSHVYNGAGTYVVTLKVKDEESEQQTSVVVVVGEPPSATMVSPGTGDRFFVGEVLRLKGVAYDYEGNQIDDDQIVWEVRQHHADHFHPFLDETSGNGFDLFPAPEPEDFFAATNSFLRVIMKATDSNGLTTVVSRDVMPKTVTLYIETEPEGLKVTVDEYEILGPKEITSWENFNLPLEVREQSPFRFKEWSFGGTNPQVNVTILANVSNPVIRAKFCLERNSFCGVSSICCSGFCSSQGICDGSPYTDPPSLPVLPPEDNVDDEFGDLPILPGVSDPFEDDDEINIQSNSQSGGDGNLGTSEKWLLSLLTIVVVLFPCCLGFVYIRRCRRGTGRDEQKRSLDLAEDQDQESIASLFTTPAKESLVAVGAALSEGASNFTSSIWEKLAEENERRARLRAKLDSIASETTPAIRTPETVAASPESIKTASSSGALSASIDDTLVRLDDILSRTFQFSRSRRSERSTPEKQMPAGEDDQDKAAACGSPDSDTTDVYLDTSSHLLIPLGDSSVPHSPLREDAANSFAVDLNPYSFVSGGGLEDDLNGSLVQSADHASVHSGSGRLLCHDPLVPVSLLLNACDESSVADSELLPNAIEDVGETHALMQLCMDDGEKEASTAIEEDVGDETLMGIDDDDDDDDSIEDENQPMIPSEEPTNALNTPRENDSESVAGEDVRLQVASFDESATPGCADASKDEVSSDGDGDSSSEEEVEQISFYSADSTSGHSLV